LGSVHRPPGGRGPHDEICCKRVHLGKEKSKKSSALERIKKTGAQRGKVKKPPPRGRPQKNQLERRGFGALKGGKRTTGFDRDIKRRKVA